MQLRKKNPQYIEIENTHVSEDYDDSLTNVIPQSKMQIDNTGMRKFTEATCTLGPNADYAGELKVGMKDHRGYFEIVSVK